MSPAAVSEDPRAPRAVPMTGRLVHTALVIGLTGTGKTPNLQEFVHRNWQDGCRFVFYDRLGYWHYFMKWRPSATERLGLARVEDPDWEKLPPRPNVWQATEGTPEDAAAWMIEHVPWGTLVVDEIADGFSARRPPDINGALCEIARAGRNPAAHGRWKRAGPVALLAACQRPMNVATDFRELVDRYYVGHVDAGSDYEWVRKATSDAFARRCLELPVGRFLVFERL